MDVVDDVLFALDSYKNNQHDDQGIAYLEIYGVLQALSIQQDAVRELHKIVTGRSVDLESVYPDVQAIRDILVKAAGHPVTGRQSSHFVVRHSVGKGGFQLWSFDQNGNQVEEHVNLISLIQKNATALDSAMSDIIAWIEEQERLHKQKFSKQSITDVFRLSTYFMEKISTSIRTRDQMGIVGATSILDMLSKFQADLLERGEHFSEAHYMQDIARIKYALARYETYIRGTDGQNEDDAYILAGFIGAELSQLRRIAAEIDADYKI